MFTGIIEEMGEIRLVAENIEGRRFQIAANRILSGINIGDSIAVDGVCLTVEKVGKDYIEVQAVSETLGRTTLAKLPRGAKVNLERAMAAGGRFGGHFVQGHIDSVAPIVDLLRIGNAATMRIAVPDTIRQYVVEKGSLAVNGISLTVAGIENELIEIALIPVTLTETNLGEKKIGDEVNLEVDILAKYVEKILERFEKEPLTLEKVKQWGFNQ
ncbi:MAG TPA: riboflavin synthase [Candidatus Marinimicrobia bacterium]|nr:riboflavin synthase [Candidatus Neomarinimicrobiota bacterium]HRS51194.1 riboflavin synthase [Candidatus Neomarinimicrobiota bacterium]HRU91568.1 riboflavin synthase [Candidatus Neomarinimicrobiota bacterium]